MMQVVDFDWLKNPRGRRSALATVHTAVRRGWLAGPEHAERRGALVAVLVELERDPALRPREHIRIIRIFATMMGAEPLSRLLR